jgi:putative inorganic carbon (hco3(-)) transporter
MERLTFNVGSTRTGPLVVTGRAARARLGARARAAGVRRSLAAVRERYDWDYLWMLAFTALLFFRPQDHLQVLASLHLAELTAITGLAAMAVRRLRSGQSIVKVNPEVVGVFMLGAVIVLTMPFSIWPGGSLQMFSDIYVKIILIFALMMSTITTPRRLRQMLWIMIVASGYIAARGVFDYVRGENLVEDARLRGAIGGMFENPNDLALNLVTFLAPTLFVIIEERKTSRRLVAGVLAALMLAATVFTKSRSGFLGLVAMGAVVVYYTAKVKPGIVFAVLLGSLLLLPAVPQSFWTRMDSIMNAETDETGSRAARLRLFDQGVEVFAENPVTGIGAGQFKNYNAPGVVERWRVTHNVWLQVAAELGIFGLIAFLFLVIRGYAACFATLRMLRPQKRIRLADRGWRTVDSRWPTATPVQPALSSAIGSATESARRHPQSANRNPPSAVGESGFSDEERRIVHTNAQAMIAALVGWTVCACFASVAFNWTFYYVLALAVAGREIAASRRRAAAVATEPAAAPMVAPRLARAHA